MTSDPPLFVIRGGASPEEVAAIVAVLQLVRVTHAADEAERARTGGPRSEWSSPHRRLRGPHRGPTARPGGWRGSGLPS